MTITLAQMFTIDFTATSKSTTDKLNCVCSTKARRFHKLGSQTWNSILPRYLAPLKTRVTYTKAQNWSLTHSMSRNLSNSINGCKEGSSPVRVGLSKAFLLKANTSIAGEKCCNRLSIKLLTICQRNNWLANY